MAGRCEQNPAVPLVCPLDIQGACESSVFGDIIKKTEATSNTGIFNLNWKAQLEGSSLILGLVLGVILTLMMQVIIKYIRSKRRQGQWLRGMRMQMPQMPWWTAAQNSQPQHQPMLPVAPVSPAPAPAVPQPIVMSPQVSFTQQPQHQPMAMAPHNSSRSLSPLHFN